MDEYRPVKAERNRRQRFKERARTEYIAGAEEDWRRRTGRPMTAEELERVLRRYPGGRLGQPRRHFDRMWLCRRCQSVEPRHRYSHDYLVDQIPHREDERGFSSDSRAATCLQEVPLPLAAIRFIKVSAT